MSERPAQPFLVLGAGSWGTALAIHLARQQHDVVLWGHEPEHIQSMQHSRSNATFLPGVPLPDAMRLTSSLDEAFGMLNNPIVLIVVPSQFFASVCDSIAPFLKPDTPIIWATKGLSPEGELLHIVCEARCGKRPMAVLSGPNFAKEVAADLPTATTIASTDIAFGERLQAAFHGPTFRVYLCDDIIGVELGGVLKNALAIAVGMSDGLGFGANARAALITRGLAELSRLGDALGANPSTLMGLSGVGDMVLTCTDNQSRNRRFGLALGKGDSQEDAQNAIGQVVEGKKNARQLMQLANKHGVELPICQQVFQVLFEGLDPKQAVFNLVNRTPKQEEGTRGSE